MPPLLSMSRQQRQHTGPAQPPTGYDVEGFYTQSVSQQESLVAFFPCCELTMVSNLMASHELQEQLEQCHDVMNVLAELPGKLKHDIMVRLTAMQRVMTTIITKVPLGKHAFFPGHIYHTNEMLVRLGPGATNDTYYAKATAGRARQLLDTRATHLGMYTGWWRQVPYNATPYRAAAPGGTAARASSRADHQRFDRRRRGGGRPHHGLGGGSCPRQMSRDPPPGHSSSTTGPQEGLSGRQGTRAGTCANKRTHANKCIQPAGEGAGSWSRHHPTAPADSRTPCVTL